MFSRIFFNSLDYDLSVVKILVIQQQQKNILYSTDKWSTNSYYIRIAYKAFRDQEYKGEGALWDLVSPVCGIFTDSALWSGSVIESPCPSVCLLHPETPSSDDQRSCFFSWFFKCAGFDKPTMDNRGVRRGRCVAVAFGCWHFNGTSMALQ